MILDVSNTKYDYKLGDNLEFLLTYGVSCHLVRANMFQKKL